VCDPSLRTGSNVTRMATYDTPTARAIGAASPASPFENSPSAPSAVRNGSAFDPAVPHPARVYGCWLGSKDHFPADRQAAEEVMRLRPQVVASARANRHFLARVVRYLAADCGIRQFLDVGTGMPAPGSTHEIAQQAAPDSKIVYVDNDPVVLVHARALLGATTPEGTCSYVAADLREPETIVAQASQTLNFTQPVAILLLAILHFVSDADDPADLVAMLASALAPGSYLAISHLTGDLAPEQVAAATAAYNTQVPVPVTARTHAQVTGLFGGLPLLAPGVVPVTEWRPEVGNPFGQPADLHGGVARIPAGPGQVTGHDPRPRLAHLPLTARGDPAAQGTPPTTTDRNGPR
jgi:S-adenosyl methyltransferase